MGFQNIPFQTNLNDPGEWDVRNFLAVSQIFQYPKIKNDFSSVNVLRSYP